MGDLNHMWRRPRERAASRVKWKTKMKSEKMWWLGVAAMLAVVGCFSTGGKDGKPAGNEKAATNAVEKVAATNVVVAPGFKPEAIFGAPLGSKIDAEMKQAGVKADRVDGSDLADVYHLACSALRRPDFKFKKIGQLTERYGFYPCQVWVDRNSREIMQIFASPIAGAKDEERDATGERYCKIFEPVFGKYKKEVMRNKIPCWQFSFRDSEGRDCRAVLRTSKSDRDKLWSYHIMVYRVVRVIVEKIKEKPQKPVEPFGLFNRCRDKVAILRVGNGNGTGFLVKADGKTWLYTNEHMARSGNRIVAQPAEGPEIELGAMELALDRDLVRYEVKSTLPAFELAAKVPDMRTEICVVGNSAGGGVLTELCGRVLGEGKLQLEIDAEFVPGNSGSPVFTRDFKVVGVATNVTKPNLSADSGWISQDTRFARPRRYALRTDNVKWVPVERKVYERIVKGVDKK